MLHYSKSIEYPSQCFRPQKSTNRILIQNPALLAESFSSIQDKTTPVYSIALSIIYFTVSRQNQMHNLFVVLDRESRYDTRNATWKRKTKRRNREGGAWVRRVRWRATGPGVLSMGWTARAASSEGLWPSSGAESARYERQRVAIPTKRVARDQPGILPLFHPFRAPSRLTTTPRPKRKSGVPGLCCKENLRFWYA